MSKLYVLKCEECGRYFLCDGLACNLPHYYSIKAEYPPYRGNLDVCECNDCSFNERCNIIRNITKSEAVVYLL